MVEIVKRTGRKVRSMFAPKGSLTDRVEQLERELDECRRDNLRVAEMLDLIEQKLTP